MNRKNLISLYIYVAFFFILATFIPIKSASADGHILDVDLSLTPEWKEVNVANMKPGDYLNETLSINNAGNVDLEYVMTSEFVKGSQIFYDILELKVTLDEELIYDGSLRDFAGYDRRFLAQNSADEWNIFLKFPFESGNEYQGLGTEVVFKFVAEAEPPSSGDKDSDQDRPEEDGQNGSSSPNSPKDPPSLSAGGLLPQTGEGTPFLYYLIGGVLLAVGLSLYGKSYLMKLRRE